MPSSSSDRRAAASAFKRELIAPNYVTEIGESCGWSRATSFVSSPGISPAVAATTNSCSTCSRIASARASTNARDHWFPDEVGAVAGVVDTRRVGAAAGAQRGEDPLVADAVDERLDRDLELAAVHAKARDNAARPRGFEAPLERFLFAERLDGDVDAAPLGEPLDRRNRVLLSEVDHGISAAETANVRAGQTSSVGLPSARPHNGVRPTTDGNARMPVCALPDP
jgi:hypothetical protein